MSVRLSSNAWHFKIQKIAFGVAGRDKTFCGYFWKTVAAVLLVVPSVLAQGAFQIVKYFYETTVAIKYAVSTKVVAPASLVLTKRAISKMSEEQLFKCLWILKNWSKVSNKVYNQAYMVIKDWRLINPNSANIEAFLWEQFANFEVVVPRQTDFAGILSKVGKYAFLGLYGVFLLGVVGLVLVASVMSIMGGKALIVALCWGCSIALLGGPVGLIYLADKGYLHRPGKLISSPFVFVALMIRAFKERSCPIVEWVD